LALGGKGIVPTRALECAVAQAGSNEPNTFAVVEHRPAVLPLHGEKERLAPELCARDVAALRANAKTDPVPLARCCLDYVGVAGPLDRLGGWVGVDAVVDEWAARAC
jgi:hypothetical protein